MVRFFRFYDGTRPLISDVIFRQKFTFKNFLRIIGGSFDFKIRSNPCGNFEKIDFPEIVNEWFTFSTGHVSILKFPLQTSLRRSVKLIIWLYKTLFSICFCSFANIICQMGMRRLAWICESELCRGGCSRVIVWITSCLHQFFRRNALIQMLWFARLSFVRLLVSLRAAFSIYDSKLKNKIFALWKYFHLRIVVWKFRFNFVNR